MSNLKDYIPADKYVVLNDNDPDLRPIVLKLPEPPPLKYIDGYGDYYKDQRFKRLEVPRRLIDLEEEAVQSVKEELATNKNNVVTLLKIQKKFWEMLTERNKDFKNEINFIRKFWWHRMNGYWFYNMGKPTYITGKHFFYLNVWRMDTNEGEDRPGYRDRDRKEYLFVDYCYTSNETFEKIDKDGFAVPNEDGTYSMINLVDRIGNKHVPRRICYGKHQAKNRRSGNTNKSISNGVEVITRTIGTDGGGIQSYSNDNAEEHFKMKLLPSFDKFPIWIKPFTSSGRTSDSLKFDVGKNEYAVDSLQTKFVYATTASEKYFDGKKMTYLLVDEAGKCFGKGTEIRMFDGSVKNVEDIRVGDVLMGDDSLPRNVLRLARGVDEMYKIIPNQGKEWTCNSEHILCLKSSDGNAIPGVRGGDYFKKTIKEYLKMKPRHKLASVMYKKPVKYTENKHVVEPYFLGLWLGDGYHGGVNITNIDIEIIDYLKEFSSLNDTQMVRDEITYHLSRKSEYTYFFNNGVEELVFYSVGEIASYFDTTISSINWTIKTKDNYRGYEIIKQKNFSLIEELRKIGVIGNKHIPKDYLFDSEENRLSLLAGLIDSDGYAYTGNRTGYEVTQKRKVLAENIRRLALDLGFSCSMYPKIARMKREDGSVYECEVFRVSIYGLDLWRIPCKVNRKRYERKPHHPNTRNPLHTGFSVESIGVGDYYGFVIDGNRRFLLEDNTVAHNTSNVSVLKRHDVNKNCCAQGNGRIIFGYLDYPSTSDELTDGSFDYRFLANTSNFYQRIKSSGQTFSGLFRLFIPATEGLDGFIDSYGFSVKDTILDYQREEGFTQTALEFLQGKRDVLLQRGDSESMRAYREEKKLFPIKYADCWLGEAGSIGFPLERIDERLAELRREDKTVRGDLVWVNGFGSDVEFVHDEENGRFRISEFPSPAVSNKRIQISTYSSIKGKHIPMWRPQYPNKYVLGCDPFKFGTKQDSRTGASLGKKSRLSDGGIAILLKYDPSVDGGKEIKDWDTYKFVLSYRHRPANSNEFNEDTLKAAIYFGAMVYPETNLDETLRYFIEKEYGAYLLYDIDLKTGRYKEKAGCDSLERSKQLLFSRTRDYLENRCHVEAFAEYLQECKEITGMEMMRHYDRLTAHGMCLMGAETPYAEEMLSDNSDSYNAEDYWNFA